jgi:uncharacterized protein (DUF1800 family)
MDGTIKRDANGAPLQTYSQADVIDATKALSGWQTNWNNDLPRTNGCNCMVPMIPKDASQHNTSAKKILGVTIPAGQTTQQDMDSFIKILVNHPNTAPFVSRRLIQNLVTSDPVLNTLPGWLKFLWIPRQTCPKWSRPFFGHRSTGR